MSNEKRRTFDGKFKERAVALAKERGNVAQAARELKPVERAFPELLKNSGRWSVFVSGLPKPKRSSKS